MVCPMHQKTWDISGKTGASALSCLSVGRPSASSRKTGLMKQGLLGNRVLIRKQEEWGEADRSESWQQRQMRSCLCSDRSFPLTLTQSDPSLWTREGVGSHTLICNSSQGLTCSRQRTSPSSLWTDWTTRKFVLFLLELRLQERSRLFLLSHVRRTRSLLISEQSLISLMLEDKSAGLLDHRWPGIKQDKQTMFVFVFFTEQTVSGFYFLESNCRLQR